MCHAPEWRGTRDRVPSHSSVSFVVPLRNAPLHPLLDGLEPTTVVVY